MVKEDRVKRKLPQLLADGKLSVYPNFREYQKRRRKLTKIERRYGSMFNHYFKRIVRALEDFDRVMNEVEFEF